MREPHHDGMVPSFRLAYKWVRVTTQVVIERQCTARCLQRVAPRISEVCTQ